MKRRVLFLCTGNSARSQMAERLVNHFLGDEWEAYSAGTAPAGYVEQDGILSYSKSEAEFRTAELDFVVTLCDNGAQTCPLWLGSGRVKHIGFPDPTAATGSEDERLDVFRQVRDGIRQKVMHYLEEKEVGSDDKTTGNL
jgi:arsenate reductase